MFKSYNDFGGMSNKVCIHGGTRGGTRRLDYKNKISIEMAEFATNELLNEFQHLEPFDIEDIVYTRKNCHIQ